MDESQFYAKNNVTPTYTFTPTMSASGAFTITSAASGTYTAAVKHIQSLQYDFGELKMSDANGDDVNDDLTIFWNQIYLLISSNIV
ncbi:MAG: hypothetical protein GY796_13445 [Chloroflexi bacterium]|nr:hypothetical protein [Chloroflexota bacterium]